MTYKIIGDSCLDLTEELKRDPRFQMVPLTLQVGAAQVVDDETFDQKAFIRMVKECPECPKTACPSPEIFKEAYEAADAEAVFVITLSSHLSGSYNSAALAKQLYEEEMKEKGITSSKKIEVLDSESASAGQLEQALYIRDLCEQGLNFEEVVEKLRKFRDEMHLLLKEEQTAAYTVEIWKRFRKWGGIPTGITQNVKDLLSSREVENIFENSDFVYMLNQAGGDRQILAKQLGISTHQLSYVTHSGEGEGLLFYGSTILPFVDHFPKNTELYRIMTTKPQELKKEDE